MSHFQQNSLIDLITVTATSGGTLTLINSSNSVQRLTGTMGHTVVLPDATTCVVGKRYYITNRSTSSVSVQYNDTSAAATLSANTEKLFIVTNISTSNGVWDISTGSGGGGGGGSYTQASINNNQTSAADVTGLLVDSSLDRAFKAEYSIVRTMAGFDGTEDTGFYTNLGTAFNSDVLGISNATNGDLYIGGDFTSFNGNTRNRMVKLQSDGTEITSFYTNLGTGFNDTVFTVFVQADGKILVGGIFTDLNGNTRNSLVRLNSDGTEDTSFYTNLGTGFSTTVTDVRELASGKIIVCGAFTSFNGNTRNYAVLLNSDGTEDTTFYTNLGSGFNLTTQHSAEASTNQIFIVGSFSSLNGNSRGRIVLLNQDGTEDSTFVTNSGTGFNNQASDCVVNGAFVYVGGVFTDFNGATHNRIAKIGNDGNYNGTFFSNIGTGFNLGSSVEAIQITNTGVLMAGGTFTSFNGNTRNRIEALNLDGTENSTVTTNLGTGFGSTVQVLWPSTDGFLAGGTFTSFNGNTRNNLVKFIQSTQELVEVGSFRGFFEAANWTLGGQSSAGDDAGVDFSITSLGQVQYVSSNLSGTVILSYVRFIMTLL